jgi:hypothetical protein
MRAWAIAAFCGSLIMLAGAMCLFLFDPLVVEHVMCTPMKLLVHAHTCPFLAR